MLTVREDGVIFDGPTRIKKQYLSTGGRNFVVHKGRTVYVHKLVAVRFVKNPNEFKNVKHLDGDVLNNHYKNLEWVERRKGPKLNPELVAYIKASDKSGVELAADCGVSPSTICNIRKGRRWN